MNPDRARGRSPRRDAAVRRRRGRITVFAVLAALLSGLLSVVSFPQAAVAAVRDHTMATFNMHYSGDRWQHGVYSIAKNVEFLALQEVRDEDAWDTEPADGVAVQRTTRVNGYTVQRFRWVNCTGELVGHDCVIYKLNSTWQDRDDKWKGRNRSLAIVVNQPQDEVTEVNVIERLGPDDRNPKPALGIRLRDGTWIYSMHATNRSGAAQNNNAPDILNAIAQVSGPHWAVMGDFNRTPESLPALPAGSELVRSELPTHPVGAPTSELDYMVAKGLPQVHQYTGFRLTFEQSSDHYPVQFRNNTTNQGAPRTVCGLDFMLRAAATTECGSGKLPATVSMGDSYISGEGGRWAGNGNAKSAGGSVYGTDRAAYAPSCGDETNNCGKTYEEVYVDDSWDNGCHRSDTAEIKSADIAGIPEWRRFNLACSGAETKHVISEGLKGERPQTEQLKQLAAQYDVKVIALSVGGNDLKFSEVLTSCARRFLLGDGPCKDSQQPAITARLADMRKGVEDSLDAIRGVMRGAGYADGDYTVVLQSYPAPLPRASEIRYPGDHYDRYTEGGMPFYDADADWTHDVLIPEISTTLRDAASAKQVAFLDLSGAFTGHELGARQARQATADNSLANPLPADKAEWVRWVPYLNDFTGQIGHEPQGDQSEAVHPDAYGQQALGACLAAALTQASPGPSTQSFRCGGTSGGPGDMRVGPAAIDAAFLDLSVKDSATPVIRLFSGGRTASLNFDPAHPEAATLSPSSDFPEPQHSVLRNIDSAVSTLGSVGTFLAFDKAGQYARFKPGPQGVVDATVAVADQPKAIGDAFHALRGTVFESGIDAVFNVPGEASLDNEVFIFKGSQYARLRVDLGGTGDRITNGPMPIADNWGNLRTKAPDFTQDLDSAFQIGAFAYFFKGDRYIKVKVTPDANGDQVVEGPRPICDGFKPLCGTVFGGDRPTAGHGGQPPRSARYSTVSSGTDSAIDLAGGNTAAGARIVAWTPDGTKANQQWVLGEVSSGNWQIGSALAPDMVLDHNQQNHHAVLWNAGNGKPNQLWQFEAAANGWFRMRNGADRSCLTAGRMGDDLTLTACDGSAAQLWKLSFTTPPSQTGDPFDGGPDNRTAKPAVSGPQSACRPDGMAATAGVDARYCDVYDASGREWLGGGGQDKRVVGYFTGTRTGAKGEPRYLVKNIPWSKVTHVNYAFAGIVDNRISVGNTEDPANEAVGLTWPGVPGAEMDPSLPYQGHFNQLAKYRKQHPQVKSLISVGGWAGSKGFYAMATNADGSVNQAGVDTFADSVVGFLDRYKEAFDGVDIDYEYPTALPQTGNPDDWGVADPRRKGLQAGYNALMKTLRARLDRAGADRGRYYLLTSAASASGYLVRGYDGGQALQYQDFVNVMAYDLHGSWNGYVGPQGPLYDDGRDNELAAAGVYDAAKNPEFDRTGYFNVDWAYHYYRGALPPGRINLGIPYYTRGWQNVGGGTDGLWGTSALADQGGCQPGTGTRAPCGNGAVGIDNIWHDLDAKGREVGAGTNPLWHAKNLQNGIAGGYLSAYTDPGQDAGRLKGSYLEKYDPTLRASWLWNPDKKVFLSTENDASIDAKTAYVKDNGIGGVMIWELAGDYAKRPNGEYGMGYDVTTRIDRALHGSGPYRAERAGNTEPPSQVVDVKAEFVDFATDTKDMWPVQPTLRITNNSGTALTQGTELSFDLPTSAPPLVKDGAWQKLPGVTAGRSGPNVGGLGADFHRVTVKLEYCQDIAPGKSLDLPVKYFLPATGPSDVTVRVNGKDYGSTGDNRPGTTVVSPPQGSGAGCRAPQWDSSRSGDKTRPYSPGGGRSWTLWDKGGGSWQFEREAGSVMDHNTREHRVGLWQSVAGNGNQAWKVNASSFGYTVENGGLCMTAGDVTGDVTMAGCDGSARQQWELVTTDPATGTDGGPGAPQHGKAFKLRARTGVYAEAAMASPAPDTHVVSGDAAGTTSATVWWNGAYWRATYWTMGEPGKDPAWLRIAAGN
ncbi:glycosyl hydrolase family 18 protein [Kitasatospora brasiliensis]|uniref:glycosyl hydrolase family 18 protein n=1 Tax=Kitasatospora brasiliensis TaxID=3058040 RepID=UPI00292E3A99|nr:glycosyl hydrolase family 18 protein [Kitasatospora sp. K002]